jgi:putative DNA topoisomerase
MTKINAELFGSAEAVHQLAYGNCPKCESTLTLKHVGKSTFLGCSAYPNCDYTQSFTHNDVATLKRIDDSHCPECDGTLAVKKGRYGMFIGCTNFPSCHFISTNHGARKTAEYTPVTCPKCKEGTIDKKQNRFGKYFYACDNYPQCKYVLNEMPVEQTCEQCGSPIMLLQNKDKHTLVCAQSKCAHQVHRD